MASTNNWGLSRFISFRSTQSTSPTTTSSTSASSPSHRNSQMYSNRQNERRGHQPRQSSSYGLNQNGSSSSGSASHPLPLPHREDPIHLSNFSTQAVPDSMWYAGDFMLGAGMVIIQPSTGKLVILHEQSRDSHGQVYDYWFLPKGRKDTGETLEQAALREAYEESGLRVSFLPIILDHNAPVPPDCLDQHRRLPCTEPIYIGIQAYGRRSGGRNGRSGEYLTFWYVGQIPENAVVESGTRMADEVDYETFLFPFEEAYRLLPSNLASIARMAYRLWQDTVKRQAQPEYRRYIYLLQAEMDARAEAAETAKEAIDGDGQGDAEDEWVDEDDAPPSIGGETGTRGRRAGKAAASQ